MLREVSHIASTTRQDEVMTPSQIRALMEKERAVSLAIPSTIGPFRTTQPAVQRLRQVDLVIGFSLMGVALPVALLRASACF